MSEVFFENIHTGKRYKVVAFDKVAGTVKVRGPQTGREWTEKFSKEKFERLGYVLKQE